MGGGFWKIFAVSAGDGTKTAPPGDIFDQPPCERSLILTKQSGHIGDCVVFSPGGVFLLASPGMEPSNPPSPLPHSLNDFRAEGILHDGRRGGDTSKQ